MGWQLSESLGKSHQDYSGCPAALHRSGPASDAGERVRGLAMAARPRAGRTCLDHGDDLVRDGDLGHDQQELHTAFRHWAARAVAFPARYGLFVVR